MLNSKKYKELKTMLLDNSAMLVALTEEMDRKGLIDGHKVLDSYGKGLKDLVKEFNK